MDNSIAGRIFMLMEENNITQSELAKKLEIGQSTVANWKKRDCPPPINFLEKISEILGVSIDYIVTGVNKPIKYKLSNHEQLLIREFRTTSKKNQELILRLAIELADKTYYEDTNQDILLKSLIEQPTKEEKEKREKEIRAILDL